MAIIDYKSQQPVGPPDAPVGSPKRPSWVCIIPLVIGAIAYYVACSIEISRSQEPLPDIYWPAVAQLWIFAIPIFVLFARKGRYARFAIAAYAITTAMIRGSSVIEPVMGQGWMAPYRAGWFETAINTVVYSPIHLIEAMCVAVCIRVLQKLGKKTSDKRAVGFKGSRGFIFKASLVLAICLAAFVTPTGYRRWVVIPCQVHGRTRADAEWANGSACQASPIDTDDRANILFLSSQYDFVNGLRIRMINGSSYEEAFEQIAYGQRVDELIRLHGIPPWSRLSEFVAEADLVTIMTSTTLKPVTVFPSQITAGVVLKASNVVDGAIGTGFQYGSTPCPVFIGELPRYPGVKFLRLGNEFVVVCTAQGVLETAQSQIGGVVNLPATAPTQPTSIPSTTPATTRQATNP